MEIVVLDVVERLADHAVARVGDERAAQEAGQVAGMAAPPDAEAERDEHAEHAERPDRRVASHLQPGQPIGRPSDSRRAPARDGEREATQ
jgi:hypothetical protein